MANPEETIAALKAAVKVSPDNVPLRLHLADSLCGFGKYDEAEREYTSSLALDPFNPKAKLGLARSSYQLGKYSQALVLVEDMLKATDPEPEALVIHARLLLNDGQVQTAAAQYRRAVQMAPALADGSLSERLGVGTNDAAAKVVDGRERVVAYGPDADDEEEDIDRGRFAVERSSITFAEVGGMAEVKEQVRMKIIYPLTNPDMFKAYGKKIGGGILMYGPPGCGKTYLARATAGEIKAGFIAVGISEVLEMWIGSSERNLHDVFDQARCNRPCVLFFDEVDALAGSRSDAVKSGIRQVINQFLLELDGVQHSNEGVLILAATNAPWHLDAAFRRPGRFDRILFVPPPDAVARAEILRILVKGKPIDNVDFEHLAKKTDKFSGADLQAVVERAVEKKIEQAMKDGVTRPIATKDLEAALKQTKPSTSEWFATARNYALYANQGGAYDDIKSYLNL